jgi:hypothetical protein
MTAEAVSELRATYECVSATQIDAARALGRALVDVDSFFGEMESVYESDNFDGDHDETKDLLAGALRIVIRSGESAKHYLRHKDSDYRDGRVMTISRVAEEAAKLRPEFDGILENLAAADKLIYAVYARWTRAMEAPNDVELPDQPDEDAFIDELWELSGRNNVPWCADWIVDKVREVLGGTRTAEARCRNQTNLARRGTHVTSDEVKVRFQAILAEVSSLLSELAVVIEREAQAKESTAS